MYVIDTYNLLHASALRGGPAPTSVLALCRLLASTGTRATLVLDGRAKPDEPSANEFPSLTLIYSGTGIPADSVIAQIVERHPQRKKLTVVTDDRAVALHASSRLASAIGCDAFLERLFTGRSANGPALPPRKITGSPTSGETQHWLKEFGLTASATEPTEPPSPADDDLDGIDIESLLGPRGEIDK